MLPLDIWNIIFGLISFESKIQLISTCRFLRENLVIIDLYTIDDKYRRRLTTKILRMPIFRHVAELDAAKKNNRCIIYDKFEKTKCYQIRTCPKWYSGTKFNIFKLLPYQN